MDDLGLRDPVVGFRVWNVETDRLAPIASADPWTTGTVEASCRRYGPDHDAPVASCGCGLYALHEVPDRVPGSVRGAVVMWGRLLVHQAGVRAQFARPIAVARGDLPAERLDELAATYGVAIVDEDMLPTAASEWGRVVPVCERPYLPMDLLVDVVDRSGLGRSHARPSRHGSLTASLIDLLQTISGSADARPRPGESWVSWWCRACDAAALGRDLETRGRPVAYAMRSLPTGDADLETPRVAPPADVWRSSSSSADDEPAPSPGRHPSVVSLVQDLVMGLEAERVTGGRRGLLTQAAPLTVARRRAGKAVTLQGDALARLAPPAARGWCTQEEESLALQIAIDEDDEALRERSVPLVAHLLPRDRLVGILANTRWSLTITGALRRLDSGEAHEVADAVLDRTEVLSLHSETLRLASEEAARAAIERDLEHGNTYLLRLDPVRKLIPADRRDELLLADARDESDPAARLSHLSALSSQAAPDHVERLLHEAHDAPAEAWIRMCRGLNRLGPEVVERIDRGLLTAVANRLCGHPEEAAELLDVWHGAPTELANASLHSPYEIGAWRRIRVLRAHPDAMTAADVAMLTSGDVTPRLPIPDAERLQALVLAAPPSPELAEAAQRIVSDDTARADLRIAAMWRAKLEGWQSHSTSRRGPEVLDLFRSSACYRRAEKLRDPLNWRDDGLRHPQDRPPALPGEEPSCQL